MMLVNRTPAIGNANDRANSDDKFLKAHGVTVRDVEFKDCGVVNGEWVSEFAILPHAVGRFRGAQGEARIEKLCKCGAYDITGGDQYTHHDGGAHRADRCWFPSAGPIPMRIVCERCGRLHVDAGEFATKPHHTHACQHCGAVWRPSLMDTVGVQFLPGFKDQLPIRPEHPFNIIEGVLK